MIKYIQELKSRIFLIMLCWLKTFIIVYYNKEILFFLIVQPIIQSSEKRFNYFIFTKVTELFNTYIELVFFISNQIVLIYILYNSLCYIAPALYYKEYKTLKTIFQLISIFWFISLIFLQNYFVPILWNFFLSFQNQLSFQCIDIQFESKLSNYLKFYIKAYFICNFQFYSFIYLFLFIFYYTQNKKSIKTFKKKIYFLFLLIATSISTPELISQVSIFFILILFFELLIIIRLFLNKLIWKPIKT